jgi:hypothetical protein
MAKPKRTEAQREKDLAEIARLYLRGVTQAAIGAQLGLSRQQIGYDLQDLYARWREDASRDIDERKSAELQKLDRLEAVAWEGWERSCLDAETTHASRTKGRTGKAGEPLPDLEKATKTLKGQAGNPRFLEVIKGLIERRCRILGIDAPEKHEHAGREGGPIQWIEIGSSDDAPIH